MRASRRLCGGFLCVNETTLNILVRPASPLWPPSGGPSSGLFCLRQLSVTCLWYLGRAGRSCWGLPSFIPVTRHDVRPGCATVTGNRRTAGSCSSVPQSGAAVGPLLFRSAHVPGPQRGETGGGEITGIHGARHLSRVSSGFSSTMRVRSPLRCVRVVG